MVCWLFVGSYTFSAVFSYLGGGAVIAEFVKGLDLTPAQFLPIAQLIVFLPLLPIFGIDSLFFGVLVALHLQTSFPDTPMAMRAYQGHRAAANHPDANLQGRAALLRYGPCWRGF